MHPREFWRWRWRWCLAKNPWPIANNHPLSGMHEALVDGLWGVTGGPWGALGACRGLVAGSPADRPALGQVQVRVQPHVLQPQLVHLQLPLVSAIFLCPSSLASSSSPPRVYHVTNHSVPSFHSSSRHGSHGSHGLILILPRQCPPSPQSNQLPPMTLSSIHSSVQSRV